MRITLEGDDRQTLIARLGLAENASDADVQQAVTARILAESGDNPPPNDPPPSPAPGQEQEPPGTTDPDGGGAPPREDLPAEDDDVEVVDAAAFRALTARAQSADQLEEDARVQRRDDLIATAVRQGKFPPSRRAHYQERYDTDAEATTAAINRMKSNVVPVKERGADVSEDQMEASDAYPTEWLSRPGAPEPQKTTSANGGGERRSRVITED
jgi:hypothetical protein